MKCPYCGDHWFQRNEQGTHELAAHFRICAEFDKTIAQAARAIAAESSR